MFIKKRIGERMKKIWALIIGLGLLLTAIPAGAEQIGGDMGEYIVYCNIDGAEVYFDEDYKGLISGGELRVPVYTTGTPYHTITVKQLSYIPYTAQILQYPEAGQTIKLDATLKPDTPFTPERIIILMIIAGLVGWYLAGRSCRSE